MLGNYDKGGDAWAQKQFKPIIEKFQTEVAEKELWDAVNEKRIEEIYWVGGEPLMWDIHWDIMKQLVDSGQSKDVIVRYNTNLSRTSFKGTNLYDLLPHFKGVQICASIDGIGDIVEYVRHGIKWEQWFENFQSGLFLNKQFGDYGISFDLTVTSPGLFSMKEMIDITSKLDVHTLIKTTFSFDSSIVMSPMMIPRHILEPILDDIIEYAKRKAKYNPKIQNYITCFEDIKKKQTFQEQYSDWEQGLKRGKAKLKMIDAFRGNEGKIEEIFSNYQPLLEWWNSIELNPLV